MFLACRSGRQAIKCDSLRALRFVPVPVDHLRRADRDQISVPVRAAVKRCPLALVSVRQTSPS